MNWTHSTTVQTPITLLPATVAPSVCFPSGVWGSVDDPSYTFGFVSATLKPTILLQSALVGVNMPDVDVLLFDGATKAYQANFIGQSVHIAAPTATEWNFDTLRCAGDSAFCRCASIVSFAHSICCPSMSSSQLTRAARLYR